jgi:hypothetical protein
MKKLLLCFAVAGLGITANTNAQILSQDFEGAATPALPTSWSDAHTGPGNGWQTQPLGSLSIYPAGGLTISSHTQYAIVNDQAAKYNAPASLTGPTFSLAGTSNVYLTFDYWFVGYGYSTGRREMAWVDMSTDGGATYTTIDTIRTSSAVWAKKGILLSGTSATCKMRIVYTDNRVASSTTDTGAIIGVAIDNIKIASAPASSLQLTSVTPQLGNPINDFNVTSTGTFTFGGSVYNLGYTTVTGFSTSYKVGTSAWVSGTVTGVSIAPFTFGTFTCTTPYATPSTNGAQVAKIAINLAGDATLTDDTMSTGITVVGSFPTKRPLFEEPTGTWCGFCVRGLVYMDSIWKAKKGLVSVVSVHNSDPMQSDNPSSSNYDRLMGNYITGFPSLVCDRILTDDPSNVFTQFSSLSTWYGFADIKAISSVSGTNVNVTAKVTPTAAMTGDYRLELIITEDRVHGTSSAWDQHNYYSGGSRGALQNTEYNFVTLPAVVPAATMNFDFVARTTLPTDLTANPNGIASSLPASMPAGTTQTYNFAPVAVASNWVANKLRGVVLLIDNNATSITYGAVLNSASTIWYLGVSDVKAGIQGLRVFPNPASENANVIFDLDNASNVNISVIDATGRVVYSHAQQMNAGEQNVNVPVANLATGIYNVIIATENGSVTERLSVAK